VAEREPVADPADRVLRVAENVVYSVAGVILAAAAVAVLVATAWHLVKDLGDGVEEGVTVALDGLLLVFAGFLVRRKEREPQDKDEADER
jgi:hypothetical protein